MVQVYVSCTIGGLILRKIVFCVLIFILVLSVSVNADIGDRVLKKGMSGYDVNTLQRYLSEFGFFNEEFTNYFGPVTEKAVMDFQKEYGLEVDGSVGEETSKYINAKMNQIKLIQEKEKRIREAQEDLKKLEYYGGEITGVVDEATIKAVKAFQIKEGFEVTGELDKTTIDKLDELFPKKIEDENAISSRALVSYMRKYLGKPYVYGASSGNAFDCSGFSTFVMKNYGISLKRRASEQFREGIPVKRSELKAGDLLFFSQNGKNISHVGIYIGDNNFIHASSSKRSIVITSLATYPTKYMGARRYLKVKEDE